MPRCLDCGEELIEVNNAGSCADDDQECDCDKLVECPKCKARFMFPCPAHGNVTWIGLRNAGKEKGDE